MDVITIRCFWNEVITIQWGLAVLLQKPSDSRARAMRRVVTHESAAFPDGDDFFQAGVSRCFLDVARNASKPMEIVTCMYFYC